MPATAGLDDARSPRSAGSTEGMTLEVLAQIRDTLSSMSRDIRSNNEATGEVRDRVIRLEERDRRLTDAEANIKVLDTKVAALMKDKDRRDGATGAFHWILKWGPTLFGLFTVTFLAARALGVLHMPEQPIVETKRPSISRDPN